MEYGAIIKRAWQVTWRHKALWVLGIFAGISGCQSTGSSGGGGGGSTGWSSDFNYEDYTGRYFQFDTFRDVEVMLGRMLPAIVALAVLFFMVWLLWVILGVAARGGLITGVSEIEEGREHGLGTLWGAGFKRFWSVLGLEILVGLPVILISLFMLFGMLAPIFGPMMAGRDPGAEVLGPVCGSLCLGVPLLIVISLLLGVLRLIALRYIMLGGQGAIEALGNSWRFFRARLKETVLVYLINAGLNIVAGIVVIIPAVIISVVAVVPVVMAASEQNWGAITVPIALLVLALIALSLLYTAVWGTFTSALWTLFFRQAAGMGPAYAAATAPEPSYPPSSQYPADVVAPPGPPIAGYPQVPAGESLTPPAPPAPPIDDQLPPPPEPPASAYPAAPPVAPPDAGEAESADEQV